MKNVSVGLIGRGIQGSRTPAMHIQEGRAQGLTLTYTLLDMDDPGRADLSLADILNRVEAAGYAGVNVTYPYKIEVMSHLDVVSPDAAAVGAVNTVVFRNGQRMGHNTDHWGFAEGFRRDLGNAPRGHVLLIGAGGAGGAIAHALADPCGVGRLSIHDADTERATALAAHVAERSGIAAQAVTDLPALIAADRPDGVVNATPMGMAKLPGSAFPLDLLDPAMWVGDIVYFPIETELLKTAGACGCKTMSGAGMAVFQAVRAFEHFTDRTADAGRMWATFDAFDT
ncbi:shikimate dehydrogenase [Rhodovulum sp. P5]|uniref:shikimate dehydrogenase n=1 Tax=Rhodovulum sp. P5 TaxID=1564506 RepID=UPI0020A43E6B|nr:shikimate dehydrogenase [Rhodovulum sp. P5]